MTPPEPTKSPYYADQIFEKAQREKENKPKYNPMNGMSQDGQKTKGKNQMSFYIKPYAIYSQEDKTMLTLRPRNSIYKSQDSYSMAIERVGYLVLKL